MLTHWYRGLRSKMESTILKRQARAFSTHPSPLSP
jgi:hypothetical protein